MEVVFCCLFVVVFLAFCHEAPLTIFWSWSPPLQSFCHEAPLTIFLSWSPPPPPPYNLFVMKPLLPSFCHEAPLTIFLSWSPPYNLFVMKSPLTIFLSWSPPYHPPTHPPPPTGNGVCIKKRAGVSSAGPWHKSVKSVGCCCLCWEQCLLKLGKGGFSPSNVSEAVIAHWL